MFLGQRTPNECGDIYVYEWFVLLKVTKGHA